MDLGDVDVDYVIDYYEIQINFWFYVMIKWKK